MQKINLRIIGIAFIISMCLCIGAYFIGSKNARDSDRAGANTAKQRELLDRIGEYQRREEDRVTREAERIAAERERIERTETAIRAIRQSDRRSSSLLQELTEEINILESYFRSSCNQFSDNADN